MVPLIMKTPYPLTPPRLRQLQRGVSLLEVLVSLLIFSIGVLGIVGLHAAASKNAGEPQYRAVAAYFAEQLTAQYWTSKTSVASGLPPADLTAWKGAIEKALPQGKAPVVSYDTTAKTLRIQICWTAAGADQHCHETSSRIGLND